MGAGYHCSTGITHEHAAGHGAGLQTSESTECHTHAVYVSLSRVVNDPPATSPTSTTVQSGGVHVQEEQTSLGNSPQHSLSHQPRITHQLAHQNQIRCISHTSLNMRELFGEADSANGQTEVPKSHCTLLPQTANISRTGLSKRTSVLQWSLGSPARVRLFYDVRTGE